VPGTVTTEDLGSAIDRRRAAAPSSDREHFAFILRRLAAAGAGRSEGEGPERRSRADRSSRKPKFKKGTDHA
jgi:hypothetical protein